MRRILLGIGAALLSAGLASVGGFWESQEVRAPEKNGRQHVARGNGRLGHEESLALYSVEQRQHSFKACVDQFPSSRPLEPSIFPRAMRPIALCSNHFAVLYSPISKTPLVVVERLNAAQLLEAKGEKRSNQFFPDPRLPKNARAALSDFQGQTPPVDRGHQAPAGDAPDARAMAQTFALSNMIPQDPENNRGAWNKIETDVRKYVRRVNGDVFVFTGPIFDGTPTTVGKNKVWRPSRLFKLVYDQESKRAWAYVLNNTPDAHVVVPMDYDRFVSATELRLLENLTISGTVKNI